MVPWCRKMAVQTSPARHCVDEEMLLRQRDACTMVLTERARKGLSTQDKAGRPVAAVGHYHEDMMAAYHPPGIAAEVARASSPAQTQQRVHEGRRC